MTVFMSLRAVAKVVLLTAVMPQVRFPDFVVPFCVKLECSPLVRVSLLRFFPPPICNMHNGVVIILKCQTSFLYYGKPSKLSGHSVELQSKLKLLLADDKILILGTLHVHSYVYACYECCYVFVNFVSCTQQQRHERGKVLKK